MKISLALIAPMIGAVLLTQAGCPSKGPSTPALVASVAESSLPSGEVGVTYSAQIHGTNCYPQASSISSGLPPGLVSDGEGNLSHGSITVSGVPTVAGTYIVEIVCVGVSGVESITKDITLVINPPVLTIVTASPLPPGTLGVPYVTTVQASGGSPPHGQADYVWHAPLSPLPPGLTLTSGGAQGGAITGIPSQAGTFTFTVEADYAGGVGLKSFTLTIQAPPGASVVNHDPNDNIWNQVLLSTAGGSFAPMTPLTPGVYTFSLSADPTTPRSITVEAANWGVTEQVNESDADIAIATASGEEIAGDINAVPIIVTGSLTNVPARYAGLSQPFVVEFGQAAGAGFAFGSYSIDNVKNGTTDNVVIRASSDGHAYDTEDRETLHHLMAVRRNGPGIPGASIVVTGPTLDLSHLQPPASLPFTVVGVVTGFYHTFVYGSGVFFDEHLFSGGGNIQIGNFPGSGGPPPFSAKVLSTTGLPTGALQGMMVWVLDDAQNSTRCTKQYFGNLAQVNLVLGPPLSTVTVTDLHSPNYKRLRIVFAVQPEYDRAYEINVYVGTNSRPAFRMMTTKAFLHGASTVDLSIPDIPALAPYMPSNATAVRVQVIAKGWSDSHGIFGPPPTDGGTARCAIRYVNVP